MNSKIMLAIGIAVMVWGVVALAYGEAATGAVLLVLGVLAVVLSRRRPGPK